MVRTLVVFVAAIGIGVLVAGCFPHGKMEINSEVLVSPYGRLTQTVEIAGTGWFAELMRSEGGGFGELRGEGAARGWKFEERADAARVSLRVTRPFRDCEEFKEQNFFALASSLDTAGDTELVNPWQPPRVSLKTRNLVFVRYFSYQEVYPACGELGSQGVCSGCDGTGTTVCFLCDGEGTNSCYRCFGTGSEADWRTGETVRCPKCRGSGRVRCSECKGTGESTCSLCDGTGKPGDWERMGEEIGRAMVAGTFTVGHKVTVPGKIVDTNAQSIEGNTAKWFYSLLDLEKQRRLQVSSRYIDAMAIGVAAGLLALVVVYAAVRARRAA